MQPCPINPTKLKIPKQTHRGREKKKKEKQEKRANRCRSNLRCEEAIWNRRGFWCRRGGEAACIGCRRIWRRSFCFCIRCTPNLPLCLRPCRCCWSTCAWYLMWISNSQHLVWRQGNRKSGVLWEETDADWLQVKIPNETLLDYWAQPGSSPWSPTRCLSYDWRSGPFTLLSFMFLYFKGLPRIDYNLLEATKSVMLILFLI